MMQTTCGPNGCSGCCANNTCTTPIPAACGKNGSFCTACAQGQACSTSGTCGTAGTTYAGSPCATDNDCTLGGVFGHCRTGNTWPGGYCQDTCYLYACNGTDVCIDRDCWERCPGPQTGQSTCRGGYVCGGLVQPDGGSPGYGICVARCQVAGCARGTCQSSGYCQ